MAKGNNTTCTDGMATRMIPSFHPLSLNYLIAAIPYVLDLQLAKNMNDQQNESSKLDRIIANAFPLIYLGGWALIVLAIILN